MPDHATRSQQELDSSEAMCQAYRKAQKLAQGTIILNRYRIIEVIGRGGFGVVYSAQDETLKARVALKFLDPVNTTDQKKFTRVRREINISRKIDDPRIIRIFSLENWQGIYFLVMELLEGRSLKAYLAENKTPSWLEFRPLFREILLGVSALHEQGILHRDLKPSNIFITASGQVKLLDFGLSKEMADQEKTSSMGEITGSPFYMSPEQICGRPPDFASDIYQLGLILYYSLAGSHPYSVTNTMSLMFKQLNEKPQPLKKVVRRLHRTAAYLSCRALEKNPGHRFYSVREMVEITDRNAISPVQRILKYLGCHRRIAAAILLAGLILGAGSWFLASRYPQFAYVTCSKDTLCGRNLFGFKLWQQRFPGYEIFHTRFYPQKKDKLDFRSNHTSASPLLVYLAPRTRKFIGDHESVASSRLDNRIALLNTKGGLYYNETVHTRLHFDSHDFVRGVYMDPPRTLDFNKDGTEETLLIFRHMSGMYPSAITLEMNSSLRSFFCPGSPSNVWPLTTGDVPAALVFAFNNRFSHLMSLTELHFSSEPGHLLLPSLKNRTIETNLTPQIILPRNCIVKANRWEQEGKVHFTHKNQEISAARDFSLSVTENGHRTVFRDRLAILTRAQLLLNKMYRLRVLNKDFSKALAIIRQVTSMPLQNPFLRSAVFYFRGDLEVSLGRYAAGKKSLLRALDYYPDNLDPKQRLCEIAFLQNHAEAALDTARSTYPELNQYWGLENGDKIFAFYCLIQQGLFTEAESAIGYLNTRKEGSRYFMKAVNHIFAGNYNAALESISHKTDLHNMLFTLQEFRLLQARALLLAAKEPLKAAFYFNDLITHSLSKKHLARMSAAWYLLLKKEKAEAEKMADLAFRDVIRLARGDFETRLWLFYDAWVYGKIMEKLGRTDKARQGFSRCIAANPHTALAADAHQQLSLMKDFQRIHSPAGTGR